jgi:hypothetical protein
MAFDLERGQARPSQPASFHPLGGIAERFLFFTARYRVVILTSSDENLESSILDCSFQKEYKAAKGGKSNGAPQRIRSG